MAVGTCKHTSPYSKVLRMYAKLHGLCHTCTLSSIFKYNKIYPRSELFCTSFPSRCCDKIPQEKQLEEKGFCGSQFKGRVYPGGKDMTGVGHMCPQSASKEQ